MLQSKEVDFERRAFDLIERWWKWVVVLVWLGFCAWWIYSAWNQIRWFGLGDTDDNMRIMQVRALLNGQSWFDLRQYRMNPPFGANIHWSRLVDLPIAGLILGLRPFLGGAAAERWAVAIAPMIPYLLLLFSLALTSRRLLGAGAYPFAFLTLAFAGSTNGMFGPERIDHHGWQLGLLALSISSVADRNRVRGGLLLGISTALSLAIGLEMIIYLALAGAAIVLFWVDEPHERERLRAYALALAGGDAVETRIEDVVQAGELGDRRDRGRTLAARDEGQLAPVLEHLPDPQTRIHTAVAGRHVAEPLLVAAAILERVEPVERDGASIGCDQPGGDAQQCRLAGAVLADDRDDGRGR